MTFTSNASSGLLLGTLVASVALQLGQSPVAAVLFGGAAGLAGLPVLELRALRSSPGRGIYWMVLLAMHGWLFGMRQDFGPYGLMILGSWCSAGAPDALAAILLTKASLAPWSHLYMCLFGFAGMLLATRNRSRPLLRCCTMALLAMPLALVAADAMLLLLRDQRWLEFGLLMPLLMMAAMTLAGWLAALLTETLWGERAIVAAPPV